MNRTIGILFLVLLCASHAFGQVTLDTTNTSEHLTNTSFTISNFVVATHSNKFLIVAVLNNSNADATTGVTFGAAALTKRLEALSAGNTDVQIWSLLAPTASTADIVSSFSDAQSGGHTAIALYNVNQSASIGDTDTAIGTTQTSSSLTLTTTAGDLVISCVFTRYEGVSDPGTLTPNDGTEFTEIHPAVNIRGSCLRKAATGASTTVGWSWPGPNNGWSHLAIVIQQPTVTGLSIQSIFRSKILR